MRTKVKNVLWTMMLAGVLLAGCGEDVNPDIADVGFKMKATTDQMTIDPGARTMQTDIVFREFLMGVREVEFELEDYYDDGNDDDSDDDYDGYDDDYEIEFEGRFVVDLLEGTSEPDFGISNLMPGIYDEVEIELAPFLEDGNSIFIEMEVTVDGGAPLTVEFSTKKEVDLEIEEYGGFQMDGGTLNQILVLLDLDRLIEGIDFSQASAGNDGVVRINASSNTTIYTAIINTMRQILEAGEDRDYDDDFYDDYDDDDDDDDDDDKDDD